MHSTFDAVEFVLRWNSRRYLLSLVTACTESRSPPRALVSTRSFSDGKAFLQAFRPRWHIEDDAYRELKEGWEARF